MHASSKISGDFGIKHLQAKQIYPKKQKQLLRKDTLRISEGVL